MKSRFMITALLAIGMAGSLKAESMMQEIVGDKAPHFFGYIADDSAYALHVVKKEGYDLGKSCIKGSRDLGIWVLRQLKNGGIPLLRVSYQAAKIAGGAVACCYTIPEGLLGMKNGENLDRSVAPLWKQVAHEVPTRVAGLALIYSGLKGLVRQIGFNSVQEIYHFVENDQAVSTKRSR